MTTILTALHWSNTGRGYLRMELSVAQVLGVFDPSIDWGFAPFVELNGGGGAKGWRGSLAGGIALYPPILALMAIRTGLLTSFGEVSPSRPAGPSSGYWGLGGLFELVVGPSIFDIAGVEAGVRVTGEWVPVGPMNGGASVGVFLGLNFDMFQALFEPLKTKVL